MKIARLNVALGALGIVLAGFGGMALGATHEPYFKDGFYAATLSRALVKSGHTHAMQLSLYNLIIGMSISRLGLSEGLKRALSWLAAGTFVMPIGLVLKGATDAAMFGSVGLVGALCFLSSAVLVFLGAMKAAEA